MLVKGVHKTGGSPELNCQNEGKQTGFLVFSRYCRDSISQGRKMVCWNRFCAGAGQSHHVFCAECACPEHGGQVKGHPLVHRPPYLSSPPVNTFILREMKQKWGDLNASW